MINTIFYHNRLSTIKEHNPTLAVSGGKVDLLFWNSYRHLVSLYQVIDKMLFSSCLNKRESGFPSHLNFLTFNEKEELKASRSVNVLLISPKAVSPQLQKKSSI